MSAYYDGVILSGSNSSGNHPNRGAWAHRALGPYRIRTILAKHGYRVKVIDFADSFTAEQLRAALRIYLEKGCRFLGFSTTFMHPMLFAEFMRKDFVEFAKTLAGPQLKIISGGARSLMYGRYAGSAVDYYLSGYSDISFPALLDYLTGKSNILKAAPFNDGVMIDGNKDYPMADTSDLSTTWLPEDCIMPHEALPIETARGCIFRCSFCAYPLNGKKKLDYLRSTENLLAEIRRNYELFGVTNYGFMDDTYNDSEFKMELMHKSLTSLEFKIKFTTYIKPELLAAWPHHCELLAESGLEGASLGLESFDPKARRAIRKGSDLERIFKVLERLHHASNQSVGVHGDFIVGLPYETIDSIFYTHEWLKQNNALINSAAWHPLFILKEGALAYRSEIDKNPESYGYTILGPLEPTSIQLFWKNDHMDFKIANNLADHLKKDYEKSRLIGGWACMSMRQFPGLDISALLKAKARFADHVDHRLYNLRMQYVSKYIASQLADRSATESSARTFASP